MDEQEQDESLLTKSQILANKRKSEWGEEQIKEHFHDVPDISMNFVPPRPPDGGYGWIVVFAAFFVNLVVDGYVYTISEMNDSLEAEYRCGGVCHKYPNGTNIIVDKAIPTFFISLVGSSVPGLYSITSPIAGLLVNDFGARPIIVAGSIMSTTAFLLSWIIHQTGVLDDSLDGRFAVSLICYGILTGISFGLMYAPSQMIVPTYFERKKGSALSIVVCGSGVGTMTLGFVYQFFKTYYGPSNWRDACLMYACFLLNCIVCAALMKPVGLAKLFITKRVSPSQQDLSDEPQVIVLELELPLKPKQLHAAKRRVKEDIRSKAIETEALMTQSNAIGTSFRSFRTLSLTQSKQSLEDASRGSNYQKYTSVPDAINKFDDPEINDVAEFLDQNQNLISTMGSGILYQAPTFASRSSRINRGQSHTVQLKNSVLNINGSDELPQATADYIEDAEEQLPSGFKYFMSRLFDTTLFADLSFNLCCASAFLGTTGFFVMYLQYTSFMKTIPPFRDNVAEYERIQGLILFCLGFSNICARLIFGFLIDYGGDIGRFCGLESVAKKLCDSLVIYVVMTTLSAVVVILAPFISASFNGAPLLVCCLFGFAIAPYIAVRPIICQEIFGNKQLNISYGWLLLFQGIASFVAAPLFSFLVPTVGFMWTFQIAAILLILAGASMVPTKKLRAKKMMTQQ